MHRQSGMPEAFGNDVEDDAIGDEQDERPSIRTCVGIPADRVAEIRTPTVSVGAGVRHQVEISE